MITALTKFVDTFNVSRILKEAEKHEEAVAELEESIKRVTKTLEEEGVKGKGLFVLKNTREEFVCSCSKSDQIQQAK